MDVLRQKMDELESMGALKHPEDIGTDVEYVNTSFLVAKQSGGHRLVTDFSDVGRYSKPQPSLLSNVDATLRHSPMEIHCVDWFIFSIPSDTFTSICPETLQHLHSIQRDQGIRPLGHGHAWKWDCSRRTALPCYWPSYARRSGSKTCWWFLLWWIISRRAPL